MLYYPINNQKEIFEDIQYRIENHGIEHAFELSWEEIKDVTFHQKRKNFLKAVAELKEYVDAKCEES
jgi:hypothetical protein